MFYLVSAAEEIGLKLALSETPKTGFLATKPNYSLFQVQVPRKRNAVDGLCRLLVNRLQVG